MVLHVRTGEDRPGSAEVLAGLHRLVDDVGGSWHEVSGDDPARTVVDFAADHKITQIVAGATRRSRWEEFSRGSVVRKILRFAAESGIDVHIIARRDVAEQPHDQAEYENEGE
jgi:two-component system, OmpR family, sensor histidine kinase KdpD